MDGGDENSLLNIINNYFKPGPITPKDKPIAHRIVKPESSRDRTKPDTFGKAYVNGNVVVGNERVTRDNWDGGVQVYDLPDAGKFKDRIKVDKPFPMPHVSIMSATDAYKYVVKNVGATLPRRDAVDTRIIKTVETGKAIYAEDAPIVGSPYVKHRLPLDTYKQGIINDPRQVGGLPKYEGTPRIDSDGDGMPDAWERRYGLNPNDASDAVKDCNGDGYTNIEKYINGIDPEKKVDWKDINNNHDTLAKAGGLR